MTTYEQVAGTRVDRIAGLSDALFAIALTLTVLEVRVPEHQAIMTESQLLDGRLAEEAVATLKRRNVIGQALYAFGAALCFIHTYWSIAFIVVVQAWFAFGPRLPHRVQHPHPARAGRE